MRFFCVMRRVKTPYRRQFKLNLTCFPTFNALLHSKRDVSKEPFQFILETSYGWFIKCSRISCVSILALLSDSSKINGPANRLLAQIGLWLNHTAQKVDSRGVLGTSFRFGPTSEILENIQYGGSSVVENWQPKKPFYRQRSVILRYCWPSLRLLWLLKSSWSCIVSNPFVNALSICLVPLAGITEENSTVQRDILNYGNICWHVHHL